jgi:hypothetical protein
MDNSNRQVGVANNFLLYIPVLVESMDGKEAVICMLWK